MINLHDIRYVRRGRQDLAASVNFATGVAVPQLAAARVTQPVSGATRQRFVATPMIIPWCISPPIRRIRNTDWNCSIPPILTRSVRPSDRRDAQCVLAPVRTAGAPRRSSRGSVGPE